MEIVIFTLFINVNNHMTTWLISLVHKHVCLRNEIDVAVTQRHYDIVLFDALIVEMCKLNRNVMQTSRI